MMRLLRPPTTPIGLDFGSRYVKAAQLARLPNGWRIEALAKVPRSDPAGPLTANEVLRVKSAIARQGFLGCRVVLAAPNDVATTNLLDLPPNSPDDSIEQMARMEVARVRRISPDSFEMSCWRAGGQAGGRNAGRVMAVACPHQQANQLLDLFEGAGFEVEALDAPPCALARACRTLLSEQGDIVPIVDIGWHAAWLLLLARGEVAYHRTLGDCGMGSLVAQAAGRFHLEPRAAEQLLEGVNLTSRQQPRPLGESDDQAGLEMARLARRHFHAMIDELRTSLSYASSQHQGKIGRLVLTGGCANMPGLAEHLAGKSGLEASVAAPADLAECDPSVLARSADAALTQAVGLAQFQAAARQGETE